MEAAISASGIIFAYLGLTPIISVASEVQHPQRHDPSGMILSVVLSTIIYIAAAAGVSRQHSDQMLSGGWAESE